MTSPSLTPLPAASLPLARDPVLPRPITLALDQPHWTFRHWLCVERRLDRAIQRWLGTPFALGWEVPGVGVDCVRFVLAVLDELEFDEIERALSAVPSPPDLGLRAWRPAPVPLDARVSDPRRLRRTLRDILRHRPDLRIRPRRAGNGPRIAPGDVLVISYRGGPPAHVLLAGSRPGDVFGIEPGAEVGPRGLASLLRASSVRVVTHSRKDRWIR